MVEINVAEETAKLEQELITIQQQVQALDMQRQGMINQLVAKQGILNFLRSKNEHKEE